MVKEVKTKLTHKRGKRPKPAVDRNFQFTPEQRELVLQMRAAYHSVATIYKEFIDSEFKYNHGFPGVDPTKVSYDQFRTRIKKFKQSEIMQAREKWIADYEGIPYAARKNRIEAMSALIDILKDGATNENDEGYYRYYLPDVVKDIRQLFREIRQEVDADLEREALAASGTNMYIGNTLMKVDITPGLMKDSFSALYKEYGPDILGLEKWTLEALLELQKVIIKYIDAIQKKIKTEFTVVDTKKGKTNGKE